MTSTLLYHHLLLSVILLLHAPLCPAAAGGSWSVLLPSIGISAMHMQLLPNDRVVMYDRTDFGISNISLPNGKCRPNSTDCSAHSVEYDVGSNTIRPLMVLTNVWCSSGTLMPDGSLVQTGGWADGYRRVRIYKSCATCDWQEISNGLNQQRWYATNHLLPDGRQIIIGGRQAFNYEFYPKMSATENSPSFPFLVQTNDPNVENNLYPFVFLYPDGNLFVFANNRAILFNYSKNQVVKTYPTMPGGQPRNYPSTGSAVLLPLRMKEGVAESVEVLVCGGAPKGAFANANNGRFDGALDTCGRIRISDPNPQWVMETMPLARVMGDMLLLPNGHVLIINGASAGVAGWELGRNPVLSPVTYRPDNQIGSRFEVQNPSTKPRVYHSTAVLLRDGRVLVGGSNPHDKYVFTNVLYPTELSLEAFSPSYLDPSSSSSRPRILSPKTKTKIRYGKRIAVTFTVPGPVDLNSVSVTIVSPSFNTHSLSMNQRLLVLDSANSTKALGRSTYRVGVTAPASGNFAPAGHYLLYVVHKEIPSSGIWVRMQR
ncbi:putative galactose oxidase [Helianthus annuus]|uniref:Galactose oxidase n=1 Tax=Helianthus annuus TaxID=4232 RepID=A0A251TYR2_HELAN|nr:aldehyde oxidase GLOX1 [Helianthus annuus]XP_021983773.1 aldehyde oxidase GLOX1 [Helianthus annuus]KAF5792554.1 putative galactose oxidase [Helianthus annuus]KAJ0527481.1 putative galactose oxidase [Helianthus annuus]KAJ0527483.1 putative galactose oxidase [Helianthus annuus]KAJ0536211.1 putative galactose oxidase [Helianthus annuus]KAJ0536213.1 putative galactose oxidase [Helianthus annuus]